MAALQFQSPELTQIPTYISVADTQMITRQSVTGRAEARLKLYEDLIEHYHQHHPFFLVQIGIVYAHNGHSATGLEFFQRAQSQLRDMGVVDLALEVMIEQASQTASEEADVILSRASTVHFFQRWKSTKQHKFPVSFPLAPQGHETVIEQWRTLATEASVLFARYLKKLAIETNQVESTFLLTVASSIDLVKYGISEAAIKFDPESVIRDPSRAKIILNDTLAAYDLLKPIIADPKLLDADTIRHMHVRLMKTDRFNQDGTTVRIVAGCTRTATRKTVIISGTYSVECCPYHKVDEELDYICRMAKQWIVSWRNPFATASWIHLVLARCHPFEDGNGRLTRLLASIPLMMRGYPPISISLQQRRAYYDAINKAYEGDHGPMMECILEGMQATIAVVRDL